MTKFAIISDTHDNIEAIRDLIGILNKEKIDFLVHAGDVISPFALREFIRLGVKLYIAFGNNDGERKVLTKIAEENGWEIGDIVQFPSGIVYHGTNKKILEILKRTDYKFVVFGHTHKPEIIKEDNKIIINPGEVCGYLTGKRTYVIVEDEEVNLVEI